MSGNFSVLPREVRDMIWRLVVVPGDAHVRFKLRGRRVGINWSSNKRINLGLLLIDRETSFEARAIFYGENTLCFDHGIQDHGTLPLVSRVFQQISDEALRTIRKVAFEVDVILMLQLDNSDQLAVMSIMQRGWVSVCDKLSSKCVQLQSLCLTVTYTDDDSQYPQHLPDPRSVYRPGTDAALPDADIPPGWALLFGKVRGLHHLEVNVSGIIEARNFSKAKYHILCYVMKMRATMLDYAHPSPDVTSTASEKGLTSYLVYEDCAPDVSLHIHLDIDRLGHTAFNPERRVKLTTTAWCKKCGRFDTCCIVGFGREYCACGSKEGKESISAGKIWNIGRWGGGLLSRYLPENATMEDLEQAQKNEQAGLEISKYKITSVLGQEEEQVVQDILEDALQYD